MNIINIKLMNIIGLKKNYPKDYLFLIFSFTLLREITLRVNYSALLSQKRRVKIIYSKRYLSLAFTKQQVNDSSAFALNAEASHHRYINYYFFLRINNIKKIVSLPIIDIYF